MERLLVIGGSGLVGTNLVLAARDAFETYATFNEHRVDFEGVEELKVDVRDYQQVSAVVKAVRAEHVVLTSAFMDVDGCQREPAKAREVNTMGARHVARAVKDSAVLTYVSTDYVFDGKKPTPYVEADPTVPLNTYGRTKLEGEEEVRAAARDFLIVRPAQIWGENRFTRKPTLVQKVVDALRAGQEIELVSDQVQSPTFAPALARDILALLKAHERGVYHTAGASAMSRFAMGVKVAEAFDLDSSLVRGVRLAAAGLAAPRPQHVALSSAKLSAVTGEAPPSFEASLAAFRASAAV